MLPSYIQIEHGEWVAVRENRRHAKFHNPDREPIHKVLVDGGLIAEGERADYVVAHPRVVDVIVGLKGSDVSKAIAQIRATLPVWKGCEWCGKKLGALVVRGKRIHPTVQARNEQWKREFRERHRMKLLIDTSNRNYQFSEFL
ncbi:MAG: hypothetical protein ACLGXA_01655 [Acidobacteriota bacterium]